MRPQVLASLLAAAATLWLPGCDNPACVFGGDCSQDGGGGALGSAPATVPAEGEIVLPEPIRLERMLPTGQNEDPGTPIVLVFNEAVSGSNPGTAFQLVGDDGITTLPIAASSVVGDGRVLVLYPLPGGGELTLGAGFSLRLREGQQLVDRNGQALQPPSDGVFGSFAIADEAPAAPKVLAVHPADLSANAPTTSEIVVVFSRPMDETTVVDASFIVKIDGQDPRFDPDPAAVSLAGVQTDTRVWRWRSVDDDGVARSLGVDNEVAVTLSPTAARILDEDGRQLPIFEFDFRTASVSQPSGARIASFPDDAIGRDALVGPADLAIEVVSPDAAAGDRLEFYIYGRDPAVAENAPLISLYREVPLEAPFTTFTLTAAEIGLLSSSSPLTPRVKEGSIDFAFAIKRGSARTGVELLDVDAELAGRQSPVLDLTPPSLVGFGATGTNTLVLRSDQRELCVLARANERVTAARVTALGVDNELVDGVAPLVAGSDDSGLFLAAPVAGLGAGGLFDAPVPFALVLYDRARNASPSINATFQQRGGATLDAIEPEELVVEVYDALNLAPIPGANVHVHKAGGAGYVEIDRGVTNSSGVFALDLLPGRVTEAIVTIDAAGYDLATVSGVQGSRTSIGLAPTEPGAATVAGTLASVNPLLGTSSVAKSARDARQDPRAVPIAVASCGFSSANQRLECNFPATAVRPRATGALSGFATTPALAPQVFNAQAFLVGLAVQFPVPPGQGPNQTGLLLSMDPLLADPATPASYAAFEPAVLAVQAPAGATVGADPRARVEGLAPGLGVPVAVGLGQVFDALPNAWAVRSAAGGIVFGGDDSDPEDVVPPGELVAKGAIDPDLFVRVDLDYQGGGSAALRPRISAPPAPLTFPEGVDSAKDLAFSRPALSAAIELSYAGETAPAEVHRVQLAGSGARGWTIWAVKPAGAAQVLVPLPLIGAGATLPIQPGAGGNYQVTVEGCSWESFDPTNWSFADLEREATRIYRSPALATPIP
ncbi:MAG: Bacterial Ig-like domain [Planctomycetota bacterium]